jgi:hypothetical protein
MISAAAAMDVAGSARGLPETIVAIVVVVPELPETIGAEVEVIVEEDDEEEEDDSS